MAVRLHTAARLSKPGEDRRVFSLFVLLLCVGASLAVPQRSSAQLPVPEQHWFYDSTSGVVDYNKPVMDPQAVFDRWGNLHYASVSLDPNSAGYQVFYANDVTGAPGAPFLATDIGTLYDSIGIDTSMIFLQDQESSSHILFLANVPGPNGMEAGLYYTSNQRTDFLEEIPRLITNKSGRFGMAVDSAGMAHVVWLEKNGAGSIEIWYWNSQLPVTAKQQIGTLACGSALCRFGDPQIEVVGKLLHIFVRQDPGSVYHMMLAADGSTTPLSPLPVPSYDSLLVAKGAANLQMRSAVDGFGAYHLLFPCQRTGALPELYYATNASGGPVVTLMTTIDTSLRGFDITTDGGSRMAAVWTIHRGRFPADRPRTALAEYERDPAVGWQQVEAIDDLNAIVGNPAGEWRTANRIAMLGDRLCISGLRFKVGNLGDTTEYRIGNFVRTSVRPQTTYMLPDAAAPGMSVVVETFAPVRAFGSFGHDTLDPANVELELVNSADSSRIVIGPSVVSWGGRLLSTMLFIRQGATPGDVPLRVRVRNRRSNEQVFHVVMPQRLGSDGSGRLSGGGTLGSGGIYGTRSPRGVLVVDSLILVNGDYYAYYNDIDPLREGNQGMLPLTILARGPVVVDSNARLLVSAPVPGLDSEFGTAGPGGGGGGAGIKIGGGIGFTAGGGASDALGPNSYDGRNMGSGGEFSGRYVAGGSIGGAHGGAARPRVPSGGGTGHPFGASGRHGGADSLSPIYPDRGGFGGATGGNLLREFSTGGGGGGYAVLGEHGGIASNGGRSVGSSVLIPLAGGSGGGGASSVYGRAAGGGGGGALALYSYREIHVLGEIRADGADGMTDANSALASGGGGGSGGGILIGAQDRLLIGGKGKISAEGGKGGEMRGGSNFVSRGGDGSVGRLRLDGRVDYRDSVIQFADPVPGYYGPSTSMNGSHQALAGDSIVGTGIPGDHIRVYVRPKNGSWSYDNPKDATVDTAGAWAVGLTPAETTDGLVYVTALQEVVKPSSDPWSARPQWVMSTVGGNILGRAAAQFSAGNLDFGCLAYPDCRVLDVVITNTGEQSDLQILTRSLSGSSWFTIVSQDVLLRIGPGESRRVQIQFCPGDTGTATAELRLLTNLYPNPLRTIQLTGCGISGRLTLDRDTVDLGELCPGTCSDTTVTLINAGDAPLKVTEVVADERALTVALLDASLPITIPRGGSRKIRLRACLKGGSGNLGVSFKTLTLPWIRGQSLMFRVRNMGPQPDFPEKLEFSVRDLGKDDTCRIDTFLLKNRSREHAMSVGLLTVEGDGFGVLSPVTGTEIPPEGEMPVIVRFCTDQPGEYTGRLQIHLLSGSCALDTVMALKGNVVLSLPDLQVESPPSHRIDFGPVPVAVVSQQRDVFLHNFGEGIARDIEYRVEPDNGEFLVSLATPSSTPFNLSKGGIGILNVHAKPADTGMREGRIILTADGGAWRREIQLTAVGVKPGITPDTLYVDFGDVRKGSTVYRDLRITNRGTLADDVTGLEISDSVHFFVHAPSPLNPIPLPPGAEAKVTLRFTPGDVGLLRDTLAINTRVPGFAVVPVILLGRGLLEQAEADAVRLNFDCDTLLKSFTITNTGTWPLRIDELQLRGRDPERFRLPEQPAADVLQPGTSKTYPVEYVPGSEGARGMVIVQHSAGQTIIELEGEECENEKMLLTFRVPDLEESVGKVVSVPVELLVSESTPEDIPFHLLLSYEWSLLVPEEIVAAEKIVAAGNVSGLKIVEKTPGELTIEGTIVKGTTSGTLLEIPMRVLLGRTYRTELILAEKEPEGIPALYRVAFDPGTFHALDCDTVGTIDISGRYAIKQSTPNPSSGKTIISFEIARREHVRILLYDASGNLRATLLDRIMERGEHELTISPGSVPPGLYFYEITSGRFRDARSMLIVE